MQIFAVRSGKVREKLPQKVRESQGISSQRVGGNPVYILIVEHVLVSYPFLLFFFILEFLKQL